jgi:uncharacterized DUF497 family protein
MITYNYKNLAKHGISNIDVDEVLNDPHTIWLDLGISRKGNDRLMFVGLTKSGRVLEVGVELVGDDEYVFHAMDAGEHYIKEFSDAQ